MLGNSVDISAHDLSFYRHPVVTKGRSAATLRINRPLLSHTEWSRSMVVLILATVVVAGLVYKRFTKHRVQKRVWMFFSRYYSMAYAASVCGGISRPLN